MIPSSVLRLHDLVYARLVIGTVVLSGVVQFAFAQTIPEQSLNGPGSILILTDEAIEASPGKTGVQTKNGAEITLNGGSVTTTGGGKGLGAVQQGATIVATDIDINTSGPATTGYVPAGVFADTNGIIRLTGGTITTSGINGFGIWSIGNGAEVFADGTTIRTSGENATGVEVSASGQTAHGSGVTTLNNATIITTGYKAYGAGSTTSFVPTPDSGSPVLTPAPPTLIMTGGSITTSGNAATGLFGNAGTLSRLSSVEINTSGVQSFGVQAQIGGQVFLNDVSVTTTGKTGVGLYAIDEGGSGVPSIFGTNVSVLTQGVEAHGLAIHGKGLINLADSTVITQGVGAAVIQSRSHIRSTGTGGPGTANIQNSTLISENGDGIVVTGELTNVQLPSTLNVNLTDSVVTSNAGAWLVARTDLISGNTAIANILSDHSHVTGSALTDQGSQSNVTLGNGSLWSLTTSSNLTALTNNASMIAFAVPISDPTHSASYSILTVGDYNGSDGTIVLNTYLGTDNSPTDRMVVTGDTAGSSLVKVQNTGGLGVQTVEGIEVITVGGVSGGSFSLLGDYVTQDNKPAVVAGAYAYTLEKNGISTPTDGNWYLRSQLTSSGPEPSEPSGPRYQPGAPVYEAYPQALLGLNGVSTLQQRVGNRVWGENSDKGIAQEAGTAAAGLWGRIEGASSRIRTGLSTTGVDYDQNIFKLQTGADAMLMESDGGRLIGGVAAHYVHGLTRTRSVYDAEAGGGRISTDGYGAGGTLTWYGLNGLYFDGQGQVTWYKSDLGYGAGKRSLTGGNDGFGYALSIEGGKRIALDSAWSLTPQAQLVYSRVWFDGFNDTFGVAVNLDKGDSLQGRLGLALDHQTEWRNANGSTDRAHVYGIANLYHEFHDGTRVDIANVSVANRRDRLWGGLGIGGTYSWSDDKYAIYAEGLVNTSLNNFGDSHSLKGNVGFRMRW
uniref:autotransporter family protein n=1 Tax=Castellaniella defragrans TaxID=75697 RepID=UPI0033422438